MTVSDFVAHVQRSFPVRFVTVEGRLRVRGLSKLPSWTQHAIAAHREAIAAFIDRAHDAEITPSATRREMRRLGFMEMREVGIFCHPHGDEQGERVLLGLVDPDAIERELDDKRTELIGLGATPIVKPQKPDVTHVGPGHYRWSEERDQVYAPPFPKLDRTTE
jgi:hypothetical protein